MKEQYELFVSRDKFDAARSLLSCYSVPQWASNETVLLIVTCQNESSCARIDVADLSRFQEELNG